MQKAINPIFLKPILILLAISVTAGIIYRALFLYFFVVINNTNRAIDIAFSNEKSMDTENLLSGTETFEELIAHVKDNSGDLSYLFEIYNVIDDKHKKMLHDSVVNHYIESVKFAKTDEENVIDFIMDTYSQFTGVSKEKYIEGFSNHKVGKQYKQTRMLTIFFYFIYILSFIAALITFIWAA